MRDKNNFKLLIPNETIFCACDYYDGENLNFCMYSLKFFWLLS
jgi:hypothetical protein